MPHRNLDERYAYNREYYRQNKKNWTKYRANDRKKNGVVRTWHNGEWIYTDRRHPFSKEVKSMDSMRASFLIDLTKVCWWCGKRPSPCTYKSHVEVDHVCSFTYICPRAVVCKKCNASKRNVLPSTDQLQRLFYDDNVLRDVSKENMKLWCDSMAKEIFGDYAGGVSLLLTKIIGQSVRRKSANDKFAHCKTSNEMCNRIGIP